MACARTWLQSLRLALGGARNVHAWRCSLFPTGARPEGSARLRRHRSRIHSVVGGSTEDKKPVQENDENENCYYRRWRRRTVKPHTQVTWIRGGTHSWFFKWFQTIRFSFPAMIALWSCSYIVLTCQNVSRCMMFYVIKSAVIWWSALTQTWSKCKCTWPKCNSYCCHRHDARKWVVSKSIWCRYVLFCDKLQLNRSRWLHIGVIKWQSLESHYVTN